MSLSHAFAQLSTVGCNGGFAPRAMSSGITMPQVTAAQETQILGFAAAALLAGGTAVVLHALSLVTAFV